MHYSPIIFAGVHVPPAPPRSDAPDITIKTSSQTIKMAITVRAYKIFCNNFGLLVMGTIYCGEELGLFSRTVLNVRKHIFSGSTGNHPVILVRL